MMNYQFKITNLTCDACVKVSESVLKKISGVLEVAVDRETGLGKIQAERVIVQEEIESALRQVGKDAIVF